MAGRFNGKVAIVTGAASGIGKAIARQLAAEGAKVLVADRNRAGTEEVAATIVANGGTALAHEVNVADPIEVEAMVARTAHTYGGLHLAVNNAGITAATADYPLDAWRQIIDVDLSGVFYCLKYELSASASWSRKAKTTSHTSL